MILASGCRRQCEMWARLVQWHETVGCAFYTDADADHPNLCIYVCRRILNAPRRLVCRRHSCTSATTVRQGNSHGHTASVAMRTAVIPSTAAASPITGVHAW